MLKVTSLLLKASGAREAANESNESLIGYEAALPYLLNEQEGGRYGSDDRPHVSGGLLSLGPRTDTALGF